MEEKGEKRIISKFEVILVVISVLIMGYLFMKSQGMSVAKTTETVEITNNPKSKKEFRKKEKSDEERRRDIEVEQMLHEIDGRAEGRDFRPNKLVQNVNTKQNDSSDESRFYQLVKQKYAKNGVEEESIDWFEVIKSSRNTYRSVRNLFADPNETPKSELENIAQDVSFMLQNKTVASSIYSQLENQFSIPTEQSKAFAQKGKKAISDWATFVEENKKE